MAITYTKSAVVFDSTVLLPGTAFHYQTGDALDNTFKEGNGILTFCDSDFITLNLFDVHKKTFGEETVLLTDYLAGNCKLSILTYMDGTVERTGAELSDITPPAEVTGLAETHTHDTAVITFVNPGDTDFSHVRVLKDGVLTEDNITAETATVTGLFPLTSYQFVVQTVDTNGNISVGSEITVTMSDAPDITPPGEVSSLSLSTVTDTTAKITWFDPTDSDFSHVKITVQETSAVIDNIVNSEVDLTSLTASTTYNVLIQTVDTSGNESTGVTQVITTTP